MIRISQVQREDGTHRHYYTHQKKVLLIKDNNKLKGDHAIFEKLKAHIAVTVIRKLYETFRNLSRLQLLGNFMKRFERTHLSSLTSQIQMSSLTVKICL